MNNNWLPGRVDLAIFATMAMLCAGIVGAAPAADLGLSLLSIPIFITAAVMGMHRTGQLRSEKSEQSQAVENNG